MIGIRENGSERGRDKGGQHCETMGYLGTSRWFKQRLFIDLSNCKRILYRWTPEGLVHGMMLQYSL